MARIGVEQSLSNVSDALRSKGHDVVELRQEQDANGCDCCVISGQDQNIMGIQNAETQGSVLNAHGMSADEVCQAVESRLQS
ncbi:MULTISPECIES: YkuS family protein [Fictibacillus]|uniref:YkuS family protein n=1 Tax=Fictibacillus TaxID=1329200 RepID=UPI0018CDF24F|nr:MULTISPECIES: YkuS family protein [unclassified Fictibacillus]MBH0155709.1 YkuS family protein [Fictibacillus sp. 5RED26]MBH0166049.1 YkuS family protein [Fictibacillus sp. 7GRE50]MBH0172902.1 YkuS family protein [Fictibacillus sp. 23RED33]